MQTLRIPGRGVIHQMKGTEKIMISKKNFAEFGILFIHMYFDQGTLS